MAKIERRHTTMAAAFAKVGMVETHPRGFVDEAPVRYPAKFYRSGEKPQEKAS